MAKGVKQSDRDAALLALKVMAREIAAHERSTKIYADLLEQISRCRDLGIRRRDIVKAVVEASPVERRGGKPTSGLISRYMIMTRWHRREFRKTETPIRVGVAVGSGKYMSPVPALRAGEASLTAIYRAFRAATHPQEERELPGTVPAAVRQAVLRWRVRVGRAGKTHMVRVTESPEAIQFAINILREMLAQRKKATAA
jgi:hypothetical protein